VKHVIVTTNEIDWVVSNSKSQTKDDCDSKDDGDKESMDKPLTPKD
jgi:hypothetical protein